MYEGIILAGFGGQGVLLAGRIICLAAMREGKKVSHIPSYGAEMRGGTANCSVVISDEEIASPIVGKPTICIVLNQPSLFKFETTLLEGGLLIYNSSLINNGPSRQDIQRIPVEANELAQKAGSSRAANMITLGLLAKLKPQIASLKSFIAATEEAVSARNRALNAVNITSIKRGYALVH